MEATRRSAGPRSVAATDGQTLSHIPQLDALRGLACLMVLVAHLQAVRGLGWMPEKVGVAGVGLFFVLSGFLITRILVADRETGRGLGEFYNRRVARIFPAYYLTLAVVALVWPGREIGWAATFTFNLRYMTGLREYFHVDPGSIPTPPVGHFWSLCVEEHFYWFWPLAVAFLPSRVYRAVPWIAIVATVPATLAMMDGMGGNHHVSASAIEGFIWRATPSQMVGLSLGALLAIYERRLNVWRLVVLGVGLVGSYGVSKLMLEGLAASAEMRLAWAPTRLHLFCGGVFALGMACRRLANVPGLRSVGRISYGLYLYHLPVYAALGLATGAMGLSPWRGVVAFGLTYLVAWSSFRWMEAPAIAWMRRRQGKFSLPLRRVRISVGTAMTLLLAVVATAQMAVVMAAHPPVPRELRFQEIEPPDGTRRAYMWMGALHVFDKEWFRRTSPISPKADGVTRIAVVGDSWAYGSCVPVEGAIPALAEQRLRTRGYSAEVLNLGLSGADAERVVRLVRDRVPSMDADVVVYAVNLNGFFPHRPGETGYTYGDVAGDQEFAGSWLETLRDLRSACQEQEATLLVVPILVDLDDPDVFDAAERLEVMCRAEGVATIDQTPYLRAKAGENLRFNRWDNHPSAECYRLYGEMIAEAVGARLGADSRP